MANKVFSKWAKKFDNKHEWKPKTPLRFNIDIKSIFVRKKK